MITDPDEMLEWLLGREAPLNDDLLGTALSRVGRNNGPWLLGSLWADGWLTEGLAAGVVGPAWSAAEFPDRLLDHDEWRSLFALGGYTVDGQRADRPLEPITLWRGSVEERRADWSWTDSREVAERYASGRYGRPVGVVWRAVVEPHRLLARNTDRQESEYVVDTEGLVIERCPDTTPAPLPGAVPGAL